MIRFSHPFQRSRAIHFVWLTMLCSAVTLGCASQTFDGRVFRNDDHAFSLHQAPTSWRPIEVSDALVAYRADDARATVAINGRCGKDGDDVPLESLTKHLFIYFTERRILDQRRVPMDGREALRTEMLAKLDGVDKAFVVYVLKKDRCVYDFLFVSDPATVDRGVPLFDRYVSSFRVLGQ